MAGSSQAEEDGMKAGEAAQFKPKDCCQKTKRKKKRVKLRNTRKKQILKKRNAKKRLSEN